MIDGLLVTHINQVVQSDITYIHLNGDFYYLVFIIDVYSKRIVGYQASDHLRASANQAALKQLIRLRGKAKLNNLIHHSDRGSQYMAKTYTKALTKINCHISMGMEARKNAYAERINGIIKNDYLVHWHPKSYAQLVRLTKKAVFNYNHCPHGALAMKSPVQFEQHLLNVPLSQRTSMKIFTFKKAISSDPNQLNLFDFETSFVNQKGQPFSG